MSIIDKLARLYRIKVKFSKNLLLIYVVYPLVLASGCLYLIYSSGHGFSSENQISYQAISAFFSLFVIIAGVFCIIPAAVVTIYILPNYLISRDEEKTNKLGVLLKTSLIFFLISGFAIFTSLII